MILTMIFGTAGAAAGGYLGSRLGEFGGKPIRYGVIFAGILGGIGAGGGHLLGRLDDHFDDSAPTLNDATQQKVQSECEGNAPDGLEPAIIKTSDGQFKCMFAPKQ